MANVPIKFVEAIGNILHTPGVTAIPPAFAHLVANANWRVFKTNTPDECRAVDIVFKDQKVLRFVVQNKNKRYVPGDRAVIEGKAMAGDLKPFAMQALGGAQITWVISNPFANDGSQKFLGHVYNGQWKVSDNNAYSAKQNNAVASPPAGYTPGDYIPTGGNPGVSAGASAVGAVGDFDLTTLVKNLDPNNPPDMSVLAPLIALMLNNLKGGDKAPNTTVAGTSVSQHDNAEPNPEYYEPCGYPDDDIPF